MPLQFSSELPFLSPLVCSQTAVMVAGNTGTYYDRFERSIASGQNPFTENGDKQLWENHAQKARTYLQQSKESFNRAYL